MARHIPLLFTYVDRVVGMGYTALVTTFGRVLAVEDEGEVWIFGVEPGAIAASGSDPKEALEAFRQAFTNVLRDFASEAHTFDEFREAVQAFFGAVNEPNAVDWRSAVEAVRAGTIDLLDAPREPAESRRFVQVQQESAMDRRVNYGIDGSRIQSAVAA